MDPRVFSVSIVSIVAVICASGLPADRGGREAEIPTTSTRIQVVIVQGGAPAKVKVGELVRITGSGPSGMVEITAKTEGPVKLVRTNEVRRVVNGAAVIGAIIREFEVKAERKGPAKVIVTIDNKITRQVDTQEIKLEVR